MKKSRLLSLAFMGILLLSSGSIFYLNAQLNQPGKENLKAHTLVESTTQLGPANVLHRAVVVIHRLIAR